MTDTIDWLRNQEEFERDTGEYARADRFASIAAEIERLQNFLEIALDAYEDLLDDVVSMSRDPNIGKPGHFVTEARKLLAR